MPAAAYSTEIGDADNSLTEANGQPCTLSQKQDETPPTVAKRQPRKPSQKKGYTASMVAGAAGRAVAAVGADDLPLDGQIEALELARRWLAELEDGTLGSSS